MTPSSTASTALARPLTANSQISDYNSSAQGHGRTPLTPPVSSIKYNTTPNAHNGDIQYDDLEVDEIGALQSHQSRAPGTIDHPGYSSSAQIPMGSIQEDSALVVRHVGGSGRRRRGSAAAGTQNRLTITNISDRDAEVREAVEQAQLAARQQQSTTPSIRGQRSWLSAEEEKRKLYESARAKVEQVQGSAVMAPQASETVSRYWLILQSSPLIFVVVLTTERFSFVPCCLANCRRGENSSVRQSPSHCQTHSSTWCFEPQPREFGSQWLAWTLETFW